VNATPDRPTRATPPRAARRPVTHREHGHARVDEFAWLRDTTAPDVLEHLRAERAFHDHCTSHLRPRAGTLSAEMSARLPPTDSSASWEHHGSSYYIRTPSGEDFSQMLRISSRPGEPDQVLLDLAELAGESSYVELGVRMPSPDGSLLAYSVDTTGDEVYELRFRDLRTGQDLPDRVPRTYYGGAWSADGNTFLYTVHDAAYRPFQVVRHVLGTPVDEDVVVVQEDDDRFELQVRACRSGGLVVIWAQSRDTSEVWLVDPAHPSAPARPTAGRRRGVEYHVEHAVIDGEDTALVVTNDEHEEFRLVRAPLCTPGSEHWVELVPGEPGRRLERVEAFAGHLVLALRGNGSPWLRVVPLDGTTPYDVRSSWPAGTIALGRNEVFDTARMTVVEQSYVRPPIHSDVDLTDGTRSLRHRQEAPGHDPDVYADVRSTVVVPDGTAVPVTIVHHRDVPLDGTAPALLYAYGAYEYSFEPEFDVALLSLLDRGVVFVHVHVRGGGENGRRWWLDGRLEHKQHTFSDLVDVADALAGPVVDGGRIATRGLSAGGLLQGAVYSQRPDRWCAVVAEVPFVDVVTTMLDETVPLTANEWDEWGDPRRAADHAWMLAYSPYDNPPGLPRPPMLVTGALHDPRVLVSEPAKWVARLRDTDPAGAPELLFRCELGEGAHAGPAGRYARLAYEAEVQAWLLEQLGVKVAAPPSA
jgi:oligopeptidase B